MIRDRRGPDEPLVTVTVDVDMPSRNARMTVGLEYGVPDEPDFFEQTIAAIALDQARAAVRAVIARDES